MSIVEPILVSRLIALIRSYRCIYDPRHEHHNNRAVINSIWRSISADMGQPETLCREKWINLRSNFARELRKTRRKMSEGEHTNNSSQWVHFEGMSFLAPFVRTRLATVDGMSEGEDPGVRVKMERESFDFEPPNVSYQGDESDSNEVYPVAEPRKRKYPSADDEVDDDKMFLLSLLPKMKQLPIFDNLSFRIEMQTLLLNKLKSAITGDPASGPSSPQPSSALNPVVIHSWPRSKDDD